MDINTEALIGWRIQIVTGFYIQSHTEYIDTCIILVSELREVCTVHHGRSKVPWTFKVLEFQTVGDAFQNNGDNMIL